MTRDRAGRGTARKISRFARGMGAPAPPGPHSAPCPRSRPGRTVDGRMGGVRAADGAGGFALVWASITMLIVAALILAATGNLGALDEVAKAEFSARGHAREVAEAGLVDAYAWFRRQGVQPVAVFAPRLDRAVTPQVNETDDPALGLVRTFEISPGRWGRYTVEAGTPAEPFVDRNASGVFDASDTFTDVNGDGSWSPARGTRDVTRERGLAGVGTVWMLVSRAQVFRRPRADMPLG